MLWNDADRTAFLRRRFREGDRCNGTVVRYIGPSQAVIEIEGRRVVAWMQTAPPAGREVVFIVERLEPAVVLKECPTDRPGLNVYI